MIENVLQKIGLSEKEVKVYVTSLRFGSQPISVIARYAAINRTTAYDIFEGLIKKGLASKVNKKKATYFQVLDPENLLRYLDRECEEFGRKIERDKKMLEELIPVLKSLENPASSKPKVKFFEGEKGMREAYETTLDAKEPIRAYANIEEMHRGLPNFFPEYYARRSGSGIPIRCIAPDNFLSKERHTHDKEELREMKLVSRKKYSFSPELNIYHDKVLIASWREKMAIIIESKEIADLHKAMYDLLWKKLEAS